MHTALLVGDGLCAVPQAVPLAYGAGLLPLPKLIIHRPPVWLASASVYLTETRATTEGRPYRSAPGLPCRGRALSRPGNTRTMGS